jgi:hypothetical protein
MDLIPLLYFQIYLRFVWYQYSTIPPVGQQKGAAALLPFLLRGTIGNARRCALRINSGRIIFISG